MRATTVAAVAVSVFTPATYAWGAVGHATVATIAQKYLTSQAQSYVTSLLGSGVTMASVASWADDYRYTTAGRFSAPFHYVDAEDNPPSSCSVSVSRDCSGSCILTAIANYTQKVNDNRYTVANRKMALEFLIHFLGDITQPLHDEAKAVGGNDISVKWNGATTNLHHAWDTEMVEKSAGGNTSAVIASYATTLKARIDTGAYASSKASWVSCSNIKTAANCALAWAQDANGFNCQYVLKTDETNQELSGSYYTGARPIIDQQIAKGGYRLGTWINNLAAAA